MEKTAPVTPHDCQTHRTPCGQGQMVWRRWGVGKPVVLLHGGSGSWTHWQRNIGSIVAAGRSAWVPDLPNFGESDSLGDDADADVVVPSVLLGLQQLLGDAPCDLLAFSFGSLVSVLLTAQHPHAVRRLLLLGPPVLPLQRGRGVALRPWQHLATQAEQSAVHRRNLEVIMFHNPAVIDDATVALHAANVVRDRMRQRRLVMTDAFSQALTQIHCDVQVVFGTHDVLCRDDWPGVHSALDACPGFSRVEMVADAGHWVQYEAAHVVNEYISQWLSEHSVNPPAPERP